MKEEINESANTITSGTRVRLPIGLLASFVVMVGLALWARIELYHEQAERDIDRLTEALTKKADRSDAADRYTSTIAGRDKEIFQAADEARRRELVNHINESNRVHEHMHTDINNHEHRHSEIIHENTH